MQETPYTDPIPAPLDALQVTIHDDGQCEARWGGSAASVRAVSCFPTTAPATFISLRDDENREIALVPDPAHLEPNSRDAVERAVLLSRFKFEIVRIHELTEEYELRNWRVETRQGPRTFQTHRDIWPTRLPSGELLIRAIAGDVCLIPNPDDLDAESRKQLRILIG